MLFEILNRNQAKNVCTLFCSTDVFTSVNKCRGLTLAIHVCCELFSGRDIGNVMLSFTFKWKTCLSFSMTGWKTLSCDCFFSSNGGKDLSSQRKIHSVWEWERCMCLCVVLCLCVCVCACRNIKFLAKEQISLASTTTKSYIRRMYATHLQTVSTKQKLESKLKISIKPLKYVHNKNLGFYESISKNSNFLFIKGLKGTCIFNEPQSNITDLW